MYICICIPISFLRLPLYVSLAFQPLALELFFILLCAMFLYARNVSTRNSALSPDFFSSFIFLLAIFVPSCATAHPPLSNRALIRAMSVRRPPSGIRRFLVSLHFSFVQHRYLVRSHLTVRSSWRNDPVVPILLLSIVKY